jgi:hypothetical protein
MPIHNNTTKSANMIFCKNRLTSGSKPSLIHLFI